jgi:hypothetical protein
MVGVSELWSSNVFWQQRISYAAGMCYSQGAQSVARARSARLADRCSRRFAGVDCCLLAAALSLSTRDTIFRPGLLQRRTLLRYAVVCKLCSSSHI